MSQTKKSSLDQLVDVVRDQLVKMSNPQHPAYKLVLERVGFGQDQSGVPQVAEFILRIEYVSTVAQLPVQGVSGLVLPQNLRGVRMPQAESSPNADIEQSDQHNPTQV